VGVEEETFWSPGEREPSDTRREGERQQEQERRGVAGRESSS